jgi:hypothetical protein
MSSGKTVKPADGVHVAPVGRSTFVLLTSALNVLALARPLGNGIVPTLPPHSLTCKICRVTLSGVNCQLPVPFLHCFEETCEMRWLMTIGALASMGLGPLGPSQAATVADSVNEYSELPCWPARGEGGAAFILGECYDGAQRDGCPMRVPHGNRHLLHLQPQALGVAVELRGVHALD